MTKESIKHSIKSSGVKSQNLVQPDVYQTSDLLEKEKSVKPSEEQNQNLQNLVQPGKYQTTDLLEKEINVKSSKENDQNIIQPEVKSQNLGQPGKNQTTDLLEEKIVIKSSKIKSKNIIQTNSHQASNLINTEQTNDLSENSNEVESLNLIIQKESDQNLVQPGKNQTPDLLEKHSKIEKLSQNIERIYLNKSESLVPEYSEISIFKQNKMANYSSLKSQIENDKQENSPKISGDVKKHLHAQSIYAYTDHPSAQIHSHSAHMVGYNKSKGEIEMPGSLKSQNETDKQENSPKISGDVKKHRHVQSTYAYTDRPSAQIHSHSALMVGYNKSKGEIDMPGSLKSQIETDKQEHSPKISGDVKKHLLVQSIYAYTDHPSAQIRSHSAHNKLKGE